MASIIVDNIYTAEQVLFEKFARTLVYWKHRRSKFIKQIFYTDLIPLVGGSCTWQYLSNWFNEKQKELELEVNRYKVFCENFEKAYYGLSTLEQERYSRLKISFDAWKIGLDQQVHINQEIENGIGNGLPAKKKFPRYVENSIWYSYGLYGDNTGNPIVGRNLIKIGKSNDHEAPVTLIHFDKVLGTWKGKAVFNEEEDTISLMIKKSSSNALYTHFLIPISREVDTREIWIANVAYKNPQRNVLMSVTQFLVKATVKTPTVALFKLDNKKLPKPFAEVFSKSKYTMLSSPPLIKVHDAKTLEVWIKAEKKRQG